MDERKEIKMQASKCYKKKRHEDGRKVLTRPDARKESWTCISEAGSQRRIEKGQKLAQKAIKNNEKGMRRRNTKEKEAKTTRGERRRKVKCKRR